MIVVKIGSALINDFSKDKIEKLKKFLEDKEAVVVVGGGKIAREYINLLDRFNDGLKHLAAIKITHVNAFILSKIIGGKYCKNMDEIINTNEKLIFTGGIVPGQSTDAVAAEIALTVNAEELYLVKDVGAIYDKDPKKYSNAKRIKKIKFEELIEISKNKTKPGDFGVLDPIAANIIANNKIKTYVVGFDFDKKKGTEIG